MNSANNMNKPEERSVFWPCFNLSAMGVASGSAALLISPLPGSESLVTGFMVAAAGLFGSSFVLWQHNQRAVTLARSRRAAHQNMLDQCDAAPPPMIEIGPVPGGTVQRMQKLSALRRRSMLFDDQAVVTFDPLAKISTEPFDGEPGGAKILTFDKSLCRHPAESPEAYALRIKNAGNDHDCSPCA